MTAKTSLPNAWNNLKNIMVFLKPFKDAQKMLEGENYVTAGFVVEQPVNYTRKHLSLVSSDDKPDSGTKTMVNALLIDFDEYWRYTSDSIFSDSVICGVLRQSTQMVERKSKVS